MDAPHTESLSRQHQVCWWQRGVTMVEVQGKNLVIMRRCFPNQEFRTVVAPYTATGRLVCHFPPVKDAHVQLQLAIVS